MKMIKLTCEICRKKFKRYIGEYNRNKQLKQKICCSRDCAYQVKKKPKTKINCLHCGELTTNKKFCSRSCAASYNNIKIPKRKKTKKCKACNSHIVSDRTYCKQCFDAYFKRDFNKLTLRDCQNVYGSRNAYHTTVRTHAQQLAKKYNKLEKCYICGYTLHVDCCHIIPVSDFPLNTTIIVVNALKNLIGLCKRCHWELDHGYINKKDLNN